MASSTRSSSPRRRSKGVRGKSKWQKEMEAYDYALPSSFIAQKPASPRDSARLLVYSQTTGKVSYDTFLHLTEYLPKNTVLVFNETKVLPARLVLRKETGGVVRILHTSGQGKYIRVLADKKLVTGAKLFADSHVFFVVNGKEGREYILKPSCPRRQLEILFEKYGTAPIPPYIKHSPLSQAELKRQYQTVFAKNPGSVAAPTASLHFTKRLLGKLRKAGISTQFITLHVGLGTFAPLTEECMAKGVLHAERYAINKKTAAFLNKAKKEGRPIIAVGTTVVRALETATNKQGKLAKLSGGTALFIREGYRFRCIDGIITNFHVPRSSLLMLVSAFVGKEKLFELYRKAMRKKFSFFSFGDGMLLL